MVVFDWPKIGYAWVGANRILAGPGNRRSRGNHSQKRRYRRARGRCSDHRSTKDRKNWVISFVPTPSQKTILHLWMLGLKPLAVSEPWRAESDWYLVSRSNRHNFTRDFGILNVRTTSSSKFLRPIIMTWYITRTQSWISVWISHNCVLQFCCFRFTIDFHKHLNIQ